jgi:hypothetical protein
MEISALLGKKVGSQAHESFIGTQTRAKRRILDGARLVLASGAELLRWLIKKSLYW